MKGKSTILLLYTAWVIAAVMLVFAAVEKQPDSFYTLLRWFAVRCLPTLRLHLFK
jgi:hypothetical protein